VQHAALVGFPAGFSAAAPFLGGLLGHLALAVLAPAAYDPRGNLLRAVEVGQLGLALGPLVALLEAGLLLRRGRRVPLLAVAGLAVLAGGLAFPAAWLLAGLQPSEPWPWWGAGLAAALAALRASDAHRRLAWALLPAVAMLLAASAWRLAAAPAVGWSAAALEPAVAGLVAGLVVRVGRDQGLRWGPPERLAPRPAARY